jgi:hypothetical protein
MSAGRFRVKSGIDRQTAEALMRDLASMGAACLLVDEEGQVVARLPPGVALGLSNAAPAVPATNIPEYREPDESQESGAVMITDRKPVRIESAERTSHTGIPHHTLPPAGAGYLNPSMGMGGSGRQASPPPEVPEHVTGSGVSLGQTPVDRVRGTLADKPRLRFAVGVFLVLFLGFMPAMAFAQIRAGSYSDIDDEVRAEQAAISDIDAWNRLDDIRASMLERKRSQQTSIAFGGLAIWSVCSAGLAFFWFRRIDWDFYRTHPASQ